LSRVRRSSTGGTQVRGECGRRSIELMEEYLLSLHDQREFTIPREFAESCPDQLRSLEELVNGKEPHPLSSAWPYHMYARYMRGELRISRKYLELPDTTGAQLYSKLLDLLRDAVLSNDLVSAAYLADLAFIARSLIICRDCDLPRRALEIRLRILRGEGFYSKPTGGGHG
jgi:hypothetical protein